MIFQAIFCMNIIWWEELTNSRLLLVIKGAVSETRPCQSETRPPRFKTTPYKDTPTPRR